MSLVHRQSKKQKKVVINYCFENGHEIKNMVCVHCGKFFEPLHSIEYWKTIKGS